MIANKALESVLICSAEMRHVEAVAKLHSLEKKNSWEKFIDLFRSEFLICKNQPDEREYFLAFQSDKLIGYAGARYYDQSKHENMYETSELLPSGWYLRGIKTHPDCRRSGVARLMTHKRLEWISQRSDTALVFLSENKIALPMYQEFGFEEVSSGWQFIESEKQNIRGVLLKVHFPF